MEYDRLKGESNTILNKNPNAKSIEYLVNGRMASLKKLADESVNGIKHEIYAKDSTGEHVAAGSAPESWHPAAASSQPIPAVTNPYRAVRAKAKAKAEPRVRRALIGDGDTGGVPPKRKRGRPPKARIIPDE